MFVITGVMAAGKSTVAQALAERFERSVHVRGDIFRRFVVNGYAGMTENPSVEALEHLRLRYRLAASTADVYAEAGFTSIVQDVILGPMLNEFVSMIRTRPIALVVLAPGVAAVRDRESNRAKTGYHSFTPESFDADFRRSTPSLGLWVDSTFLSVEETVDTILAQIASSLVA